jgi:hypothetical protein
MGSLHAPLALPGDACHYPGQVVGTTVFPDMAASLSLKPMGPVEDIR